MRPGAALHGNAPVQERYWWGANGSEHKDHTVTYGQIAEALDPDNELTWKQGHPRYSRVITALYHVNTYEHEHRRPLAGAFAAHSKGSVAGFAKLAREDLGRLGTDDKIWQAEMKASAAYWSGQHAGAIAGPDAQFDAVMAELSEIKRMLRKLLHG